jgi:hypothetical protein
MRPLRVVVVNVGAQHALEVAAVDDQQPVKTLRTDGSDKALCDLVCLRRPDRRLHDPDLLAAEDLIEGAAVLAVAIADQEADALVGQVETEVARLSGGLGGHADFVQSNWRKRFAASADKRVGARGSSLVARVSSLEEGAGQAGSFIQLSTVARSILSSNVSTENASLL